MLISKFNLNKFFLRKKENKEVDLESTRGEVRSLGMKAGLSYYDRVMLDNVIGFSSIEVEEAMVGGVSASNGWRMAGVGGGGACIRLAEV